MIKKIYSGKILVFSFLVAIIFSSQLHAQNVAATKTANDFVSQNAVKIGFSSKDLKNYRVSDTYIDKLSGATIVYLQQTFKGIDVFNSIQTAAFKNGKLISIAGKRIADMENLVNSKDGLASFTAAQSVKAAAEHLKITAPSLPVALKQMNAFKEVEFSDLGISSSNIKSKLIWIQDDVTGAFSLNWQVQLQPKGFSDLWLVNVDALKGGVVSKINLNIVCDWSKPYRPGALRSEVEAPAALDDAETAASITSAKYRVIRFPAESPIHPGGTYAVASNPWELAGLTNNATTLKWNDNGTVTYDSTRGNNVLAQEDVNGNNGFGKGVKSKTAIPNLSFLDKPDYTKDPGITKNKNFAITNLFYWNNIVHDISYQYGFDEVSGNFQSNNLSRGGAGNDYVLADAQDGSGTNNANFSTPNDGSSPRMQMFIFDAVPNFTVNQPTSFSGLKSAVESAFSTSNKLSAKGPITNDVILFNDDASGTTHGACAAAFNASSLVGKIALIDRGTCNFTVKVKNAQLAGAIAAIVVDNVPGEYPVAMGGTDNTITIPAVMVSYETGDTIKQKRAANITVNVTMKTGVKIDGDLDNGVIAHEYTHGISNRLTGGPSNTSCLINAEQMGEGWSDYLALMVTKKWSTATVNDGLNKTPIGTYVVGQTPSGSGIRTYPYSTDIAVNPWTYASLATSGGEVHVIGEIWCAALWEMTWQIIQTAGINTNIYDAASSGGNNIALKLVLEGMKLQPCKPGFLDGRNGILKADTIIYGGANSAAIWKAFAKRGMGIFASQGSSNSYTDGVADFTEPPTAAKFANGNLSASKQNTTALLQWQNLKDMSGNKFVVERSLNGTNYQAIGTVVLKDKAAANTFVDASPATGNNYYRLVQTASDGSAVYSAVRSLNFAGIHVSPNPAKDVVNVTVSDNNKLLKVVLLTAAGKEIATYNMNSATLKLNLPHVAPGMYLVKITGDNISSTHKLIIQ